MSRCSVVASLMFVVCVMASCGQSRTTVSSRVTQYSTTTSPRTCEDAAAQLALDVTVFAGEMTGVRPPDVTVDGTTCVVQLASGEVVSIFIPEDGSPLLVTSPGATGP